MTAGFNVSQLRRWSAIPLRLIVGCGFIAHGYAKVANGPDHFAESLQALGVPAPHLAAWATIGFELLGGLAVLVGAYIPLVSLPLAAILLVAAMTVHLPYGFSSIKLRAVTTAGPQFGPPGYETDLLYLAALATLVLGGSGPLALDRWLPSSRRERVEDELTLDRSWGRQNYVTSKYQITAARLEDLARLPAIELAAARLLEGRAPQSVLNETTSLDVLEKARREGHLWVALADDVPVGFAHVELIEPDAVHLEEIDVLPEHGRRGLGTKLVLQVCQWAAANGYESITLTTFRDVPWNMPFYARLGFSVVSPEQLSSSLLEVVEDETRRGLDPSRRVIMKRRVFTRS